MKRRREQPERVAAATSRFLRAAGAPSQPPPEADSALLLAFAKAAGPTIKRHARPKSLRGGVLTVAVDGSVWLQELSFLRRPLAQRMAATLGREVRDVRLVQESLPAEPHQEKPSPTKPVEERPSPPLLPAAEQALVDETTAPLRASDPELGEVVARALGGWRAKRRRKGDAG